MTREDLILEQFERLSKITNKIELTSCNICSKPFIKIKNCSYGRMPKTSGIKPRSAVTCSKICMRDNIRLRRKESLFRRRNGD